MFSPKQSRWPPYLLNFSDITNSLSFNGKSFRKKSMLENFRANVFNWCCCCRRCCCSSFLLLLPLRCLLTFVLTYRPASKTSVLLFLLKRKDVPKLSDQQRVVKDALVPFPLYNCVHVKTDVPAKEFGGQCSDSWIFNFSWAPKHMSRATTETQFEQRQRQLSAHRLAGLSGPNRREIWLVSGNQK